MIKRIRLWLLRRKMSALADRFIEAARYNDRDQARYLLDRMARITDTENRIKGSA